jgi:hypothetical protein
MMLLHLLQLLVYFEETTHDVLTIENITKSLPFNRCAGMK